MRILLLILVAAALAGCLNNDASTDDVPDTEPEATEETQLISQAFSGTWSTDDPRCTGANAAGQEGVSFAAMDVTEGTQGQTFFADFPAIGGLLEVRIEWLNAAGDSVRTDSDLDGGEFYEIRATIPADAALAHFYSCGGGAEVNYSTPA